MNWGKLQHASHEDTIAWAETQPWCKAMADCLQDAEWHSEGDVWTHTKMVLNELTKLDGWEHWPAYDKAVLKFTALFHDVAKPITTELDPETGKVRSPRHAVKGEGLARRILRDLGCPLEMRELIASLVRYHGRPVFLMDKENPVHEIVKLSWLTENRLLHQFAIADSRGRDTDSQDRPEDNLTYFKLLAEEYECYGLSYPFKSHHARFTFFNRGNPDLNYVPHEKFRCMVTMLAGLPGSGKDTWIADNCRFTNGVVSLDDIRDELDVDPTDDQGRVAQLAKERCREFLRDGRDFVFNATNTMRTTRDRWLRLFADYNARIQIVYLEPPIQKILDQNKRRQAAVPESVILRLADKCEPPTWLECHDLLLFG